MTQRLITYAQLRKKKVKLTLNVISSGTFFTLEMSTNFKFQNTVIRRPHSALIVTKFRRDLPQERARRVTSLEQLDVAELGGE